MPDDLYRLRMTETTDLETLVAFTLVGVRDAVGEEIHDRRGSIDSSVFCENHV